MSFKNFAQIAVVCILGVVLLTPVTSAQEVGTVFGDRPGTTEIVPIPQLLAAPQGYVGRTVQVEGLVTDVCTSPGCWIELAPDDDETQEIRIEIEDEGIAFSSEVKGRHAVVEGVMTKTAMTLEQTVAYLQQQAEERGEEFDPESVTEPLTLYEMKGTGAVIY
jgi:hypothetical protein